MRRTLSITAVAFILCIATVNTVKGQFSGGDGSAGNPYIITTATELAQLATYVNASTSPYADTLMHYKLDNDISLEDYQADSGWIPIGKWENRFRGVFDGNNKKITELYINNTSLYQIGLFGFVDGGTVKNLGVVDVDITSACSSNSTCSGGVVGLSNGTISSCYSTGTIIYSFSSGYAGGIAGHNGYNYTVSNCYSTATVNVSSSHKDNSSIAGGVVGSSRGIVSNCYSTGKIIDLSVASVSSAGGVVGDGSYGFISNCAALNPSIDYNGQEKEFGRVIGDSYNVTLINNIGYDNMLNPTGNTTWGNKGLSNIDGEDITLEAIYADGTLGGRFTSANGWIIENGKLPSLFGETVEMPTVGIVELSASTINIYPNPAQHTLYIQSSETIEQVNIYDISSRMLLQTNSQSIDISHLANGIYLVKVKTTAGESVNKIVKQ